MSLKKQQKQKQHVEGNSFLPGIKHLIECHCVLPQFKNRKEIQYHKFVVFSSFDDAGGLIPKQARCNNCGVIHNVIDVCKSEIMMGREAAALVEIKDCEFMIPEDLIRILKNYNCDLPDYECIVDVFQNQLWGSKVTIHKEELENETVGKLLHIKSPGKYYIEPFTIKRVI